MFFHDIADFLVQWTFSVDGIGSFISYSPDFANAWPQSPIEIMENGHGQAEPPFREVRCPGGPLPSADIVSFASQQVLYWFCQKGFLNPTAQGR